MPFEKRGKNDWKIRHFESYDLQGILFNVVNLYTGKKCKNGHDLFFNRSDWYVAFKPLF